MSQSVFQRIGPVSSVRFEQSLANAQQAFGAYGMKRGELWRARTLLHGIDPAPETLGLLRIVPRLHHQSDADFIRLQFVVGVEGSHPIVSGAYTQRR